MTHINEPPGSPGRFTTLNSITDAQHLREIVIHQLGQIAKRDQTIVYKEAKISKLTAEIMRLRRVQFAARSEKMDPEQRALFDEAMAADIAA